MPRSMTGYATGQGSHESQSWLWEIRGVNGRGLDLRLRVPDSIPALEPALRDLLGGAVARGNVSVSLKLTADAGEALPRLNETVLLAAIQAAKSAEAHARNEGLDLVPIKASDLLALRGVMELATASPDPEALKAAVIASFKPLLEDFNAMRAREGAALAEIIARQVDEIERLTAAAEALLPERAELQAESMRAALAKVAGQIGEVDDARIAQELALIAVKSDVIEEIDRLKAHVAVAREHLAREEPIGRKLDFLTQEFNREANTLCSKAQHGDLTRIGLDLKTVIDQLREQVQNLE